MEPTNPSPNSTLTSNHIQQYQRKPISLSLNFYIVIKPSRGINFRSPQVVITSAVTELNCASD